MVTLYQMKLWNDLQKLIAARKLREALAKAVANSASETVWASPHCAPTVKQQRDMFAEMPL